MTALNINGSVYAWLKIDPLFFSHLNSINASSDTGGIFVDLTHVSTIKSLFSFTGGSGADGLIIDKASLDALTTGSQLNGGTATSGNGLVIWVSCYTFWCFDSKQSHNYIITRKVSV